jgi:hypothetical protein
VTETVNGQAVQLDKQCGMCCGWHRAELQEDGSYLDVEACPVRTEVEDDGESYA